MCKFGEDIVLNKSHRKTNCSLDLVPLMVYSHVPQRKQAPYVVSPYKKDKKFNLRNLHSYTKVTSLSPKVTSDSLTVAVAVYKTKILVTT